MKSLRIELLVAGNINADNAKILSEIAVEQLFKMRNAIPLQKMDVLDRRMVAIGAGKAYVYSENLGEEETNNYICSNF